MMHQEVQESADKDMLSFKTLLHTGTTVSASNLFKNLPVRKQYYGTEKQKKDSLKKVEELVTAYALIRPDVRFVLRHNRDTLWQVTTLLAAIPKRNVCNTCLVVDGFQ